jgi:hypothetical protein
MSSQRALQQLTFTFTLYNERNYIITELAVTSAQRLVDGLVDQETETNTRHEARDISLFLTS